MLKNQIVPNINLFERIEPTKYTDTGTYGLRVSNIEEPSTGDFKSVFSGLVENLNNEMKAPDQIMQDIAMGSENVDVHDAMAALAKAEIGVNIATTVTGKVIQTYDKIMQMQI